MGNRNLQIPKATTTIPQNLRRILDPIREIINTRLVPLNSKDRPVTRAELVELGIITPEQLASLDN